MLPIVEVSGSPYEMGVQIGKKARRFIRAGVAFYQSNWKAMTGFSWKRSMELIQPSVSMTKRLLPKTFNELRGMSEGSGVPFLTIFVINSIETLDRYKPTRCTSILVHPSITKRKALLLAHNEDWISADERWLYVIRAKPKGEPALLSVTYGAWMPQYGVNAAGLALVADSHTARDSRVGLSQTLIGRELLRCANVPQAVRLVRSLPRADGHTYILATAKNGVLLETTARRDETLTLDARHPFLVHANFYQGKRMALLERSARTYSRYRCTRVRELADALAGPITGNDLRRLLSDHQNAPESVCRHRPTKAARHKDETIANFVIEPAARTIEMTSGHPCRNKVQHIRL